jgi:thiamine-monophosphate kinase
MTKVNENTLLAALAGVFPRSPMQLNGHQESDAELLRLPGKSEVLVLSTDQIVEEIETGLYDDPYLIGWMTVIASASDLAAVGADPVGILLSETLPPGADPAYLSSLQSGLLDACAVCGFHVLGGDTNISRHPQMGATALGVINNGRLITRRGCRPGDKVFATGLLGAGSAYAFHKMNPASNGRAAPCYRPHPRLGEGRLVRSFGSAAMDTSDGALATLDQLMRVNDLGFRIEIPIENLLTPEAVHVSRSAGIPGWMLLAGPHGEFELVFTVPEPRVPAFEAAAVATGWKPLWIGSVTAETEISLPSGDRFLALDTGAVRNLFSEVGGDTDRYLHELLRLDGAMARADRAHREAGPCHADR